MRTGRISKGHFIKQPTKKLWFLCKTLFPITMSRTSISYVRPMYVLFLDDSPSYRRTISLCKVKSAFGAPSCNPGYCCAPGYPRMHLIPGFPWFFICQVMPMIWMGYHMVTTEQVKTYNYKQISNIKIWPCHAFFPLILKWFNENQEMLCKSEIFLFFWWPVLMLIITILTRLVWTFNYIFFFSSDGAGYHCNPVTVWCVIFQFGYFFLLTKFVQPLFSRYQVENEIKQSWFFSFERELLYWHFPWNLSLL